MQISKIQVGDTLPEISIPITLQRLVMEAGANRDLSLIHHDTKVAQATGAPDAFANTFFLIGMFERLMREWRWAILCNSRVWWSRWMQRRAG
jgi:hypothetical protein